MTDQWTKARIKPQEVKVRIVTISTGETIARAGEFYRVKFGHYIVMHADGTLWQCSPETFANAYEAIP